MCAPHRTGKRQLARERELCSPFLRLHSIMKYPSKEAFEYSKKIRLFLTTNPFLLSFVIIWLVGIGFTYLLIFRIYYPKDSFLKIRASIWLIHFFLTCVICSLVNLQILKVYPPSSLFPHLIWHKTGFKREQIAFFEGCDLRLANPLFSQGSCLSKNRGPTDSYVTLVCTQIKKGDFHSL